MKRLAASYGILLCASAHAAPVPTLDVVAVMPPSSQNVAVVTDQAARISAPVTIAGRTWHFVIDTASTRSVIASDVADSLGLAPGQALKILTIAGLESVPSVIIPELDFAKSAARGINAPALERGNLGGDGLLGLDILHANRVSIDFRRTTALTIAPSSRQAPPDAPAAHDHAEPDTIVVTARSRLGELIVTDAEIDDIPVAVIIDTGSEDSIGNPALANKLFRRGSSRAQPVAATLIGVTGATVAADYARIDRLHIGGVIIANVPMAFGDVATFRQFGLIRRPALLLGMQTLRLFARVTIDFPRHQIRFLLRPEALHNNLF